MNNERMKRMFGEDWRPEFRATPYTYTFSNVVVLQENKDMMVVSVRTPPRLMRNLFSDTKIGEK